MRRVTMWFFVILLCLLSAAVVLPGYLSGYDHRDPRDRKDLKYLPFDLPPPVTLLLAALADGIIIIFEICM